MVVLLEAMDLSKDICDELLSANHSNIQIISEANLIFLEYLYHDSLPAAKVWADFIFIELIQQYDSENIKRDIDVFIKFPFDYVMEKVTTTITSAMIWEELKKRNIGNIDHSSQYTHEATYPFCTCIYRYV